jgi:hypothetical protein
MLSAGYAKAKGEFLSTEDGTLAAPAKVAPNNESEQTASN